MRCVSECDRGTSTIWRPWSTRRCQVTGSGGRGRREITTFNTTFILFFSANHMTQSTLFDRFCPSVLHSNETRKYTMAFNVLNN